MFYLFFIEMFCFSFRCNKKPRDERLALLDAVAPKGWIFGRLACLNVLGNPSVQKIGSLHSLIQNDQDQAFLKQAMPRLEKRRLRLLQRKKYFGRLMGKKRRDRLQQAVEAINKIIQGVQLEKAGQSSFSEASASLPNEQQAAATPSSADAASTQQRASNELFIPGVDSLCLETAKKESVFLSNDLFYMQNNLHQISPEQTPLSLFASSMAILIPGFSRIDGEGRLEKNDLPKASLTFSLANQDAALNIIFKTEEQANRLFELFKESPALANKISRNGLQIKLEDRDTILLFIDSFCKKIDEDELYIELACLNNRSEEERKSFISWWDDAYIKNSLGLLNMKRYNIERPPLVLPICAIALEDKTKKAEAMTCSLLPFIESLVRLQKGETRCKVMLREEDGLSISFLEPLNNKKLAAALQKAFSHSYSAMRLETNKVACKDPKTIVRYLRQLCLFDQEEIKKLIEEQGVIEGDFKTALLQEADKETSANSFVSQQKSKMPLMIKEAHLTLPEIKTLLSFLSFDRLSSSSRLPALSDEAKNRPLSALKELLASALNETSVDLSSFEASDKTSLSKEKLIESAELLCKQITQGHSGLADVEKEKKNKWSDKRKLEMRHILDLLFYLREKGKRAAEESIEVIEIKEKCALFLVQLALAGSECPKGVERALSQTLVSLIELAKAPQYAIETASDLSEVDREAKRGIDQILEKYREGILEQVATALKEKYTELEFKRIKDHCRDCLAGPRGLKPPEKTEVELQNRSAIIGEISQKEVLKAFDEAHTPLTVFEHLHKELSYESHSDFLQDRLISFFNVHLSKEAVSDKETILENVFYEDESSATRIRPNVLLQALLVLGYFKPS